MRIHIHGNNICEKKVIDLSFWKWLKSDIKELFEIYSPILLPCILMFIYVNLILLFLIWAFEKSIIFLIPAILVFLCAFIMWEYLKYKYGW